MCRSAEWTDHHVKAVPMTSVSPTGHTSSQVRAASLLVVVSGRSMALPCSPEQAPKCTSLKQGGDRRRLRRERLQNYRSSDGPAAVRRQTSARRHARTSGCRRENRLKSFGVRHNLFVHGHAALFQSALFARESDLTQSAVRLRHPPSGGIERTGQGLAPSFDPFFGLFEQHHEFGLIKRFEQIVGSTQLQSVGQGIQ